MTEKRVLFLILLIFILLGIGYASITPVFEASDELWHYPMIRHLADGNPLPVQVFNPTQAGPWKQEASQPPLYYYLGALITFWIDTSDMEDVRWLNPHVDNGVITSDGNINLVVHDPNSDPLNGTQLAVRVVRFFSVMLGAVTIYLTYQIAREVAPSRPEIALGAAAVNAFTPMFLFISGSVNNDNLVITLSSLALLLMIRIVWPKDETNRQEFLRLLILGSIIGLGALTKITALGLFALTILVIFIKQWSDQGREVELASLVRVTWRSILRFLLVIIPALLIAGWWYYRNFQLYGDWSGWNAFIAVLGRRAHPASIAQLWDERWGFMISYWGLFGGLNVPMPDWIYHVLNAVVITSVAGFFLYGLLLLYGWNTNSGTPIVDIKSMFYTVLAFMEKHIALTLCFLWAAAVVAGLVRWATITWSSQGRLVFSSISALSTMLVVGFVGWMPRRYATVVVSIIGIFMFTISALAPFLWIEPAYKVENKGTTIDKFRIVNNNFANKIRLLGYQLQTNELQPGDELDVVLEWEVLEEMQRDWSVFVHLIDPILEAPIAQRDMYLGQGLLATSFLQPGDRVTNRYELEIPDTAVAPLALTIVTGLYDFDNGERLLTEDGLESVELEIVNLEAIGGQVPNPIVVNFEDELELVGFRMNQRRLEPGQEVKLTLFWRPLKILDTDYTFFAQVIDEDTTRWASQDLNQPTSDWLPGSIEEVEMGFRLDEDIPPGVYPVIIGIYTRPDGGGFDRLQMVTTEGRLTDDFLHLSDLRVE
ncbi:MAG: hypothetical protein AMJ56_03495 [Anaerolineae bacterium SG8_19]|nr:MAG: hypothetical protein AMJ56_03495 [Anaerolineae bacterium SG8_19]